MTSFGRIHVARHGKPSLSRKCLLTSDQYRDWWNAYQASGLADGERAPGELIMVADQCGHIVTSSLRRALETGESLAPGRRLMVEDTFVEAPLPPPPVPLLRLTPRAWGVVARLAWLQGFHGGQESRREAELRAARAADKLIELSTGGADVLLCAHGWFNRMIGRALRSREWTCTRDGGDWYWAWRCYERS